MEKRERLERTLAGEATDRSPVALWRRFPGDERRAADHAQAIIDFQMQQDWDVCVITPPWSFACADYGVNEVWQGNPDGSGVVLKPAIRRSLDWTDLRVPDPGRGEMNTLVTTVRMVSEQLSGMGIPVVVGVLSPLAQAARLAGSAIMLKHLRTRQDRFTTGISILLDGTLRFLDALRKLPLAGLYLHIEHADLMALSEAEYERFGLPGDAGILTSAPNAWWLRMAYLQGGVPMQAMLPRLGANAIGWDSAGSDLDLETGKSVWAAGAVFGGLEAEKHLRAGTPASVRDAAREAQRLMGGRRLLLGCASPTLLTTPLSNLRALRLSVERNS